MFGEALLQFSHPPRAGGGQLLSKFMATGRAPRWTPGPAAGIDAIPPLGGISAALGRLHEGGLIHKDIKPANILVDSATGKIWTTGFGIASRLPRERQAPAPPEVIAGTLAYMAPKRSAHRQPYS